MTELGAPTNLQLLPDEEFRRVLCVAAHPDDLEYGTSAAVAKWVARGVVVKYLLLTSGEAGMAEPPDVIGPLRSAEQRAACNAVGVEELEILDYPDGTLVYGLDIRRDIARVIREFRPDVVVTGSWEVEFVAGLNQADHRVAGLATVDAVRDADNAWVFPELAQAGLEKWGVRYLLVSGDSRPTHAVEITGEPLNKGIASLAAHARYLEHVVGHPRPDELLPAFTGMVGKAIGVPNAVAFRVYDLIPARSANSE